MSRCLVGRLLDGGRGVVGRLLDCQVSLSSLVYIWLHS